MVLVSVLALVRFISAIWLVVFMEEKYLILNNENNLFNVFQVVIRRRWLTAWTIPAKSVCGQHYALKDKKSRRIHNIIFICYANSHPLSCCSDGNLNLLNFLKFFTPLMSVWWQLSYSQLLWCHIGDVKLIIDIL